MGSGRVFVFIILKVKCPCTTEQLKDDKYSYDEVAEQDSNNKPDTATSPRIW